jgi:predicted RNA-binding Zn-ribbon protein involved in translation (DUF1610 family)
MTPHRWFLVLLIWQGVWLVSSATGLYVQTRDPGDLILGFEARSIRPYITAIVVVLTVGFFALVIHNLAYMRLIKQRAARGLICGKCLYDVSRITGPVCPECGHTLARRASTPTQTAESAGPPPPPAAPN